MSNYFKYFPLVSYNGSVARNILARVKFNEKIKDYYTAFYPYTLKEGEKIDHVAHNYYEDARSDWIIYLTNDVIDPFYGVYLSDDDFKAFIEKKYGSIAEAQKKIVFYRNDWSSDDQVLTVSGYEALATGQKKYWDPVLSFNEQVTGYERKKEDIVVSTNKILSLTLAAASNTALTVGERVGRDDDSSTTAFVTWSNTTVFNVQHVLGDFTSNTNYTVTGETSGVTATVNAESVSVLKQVIPTNEEVYFSPVYAYDFEEEINEKKKSIQILDSQYRSRVEKEFKALMSE